MFAASMLPFRLRGVEFRNRLAMAPMSQYSASDGFPTEWHVRHYAERGGALGLVVVEATAVSRNGVATPHDLGLWSDAHGVQLEGIATALKQAGAVAGIQLSHAGRKAHRTRPWEGDSSRPDGELWAPSALPFAFGYRTPQEVDNRQISEVVEAFAAAATRAMSAGFRFIELHAGHGRLLHSFLSPAANQRTDSYGGSLINRARLLCECVTAIRASISSSTPIVVRLSCVDWLAGGLELDESVWLAGELRELGVDAIDCTSGGIQRPLSVPIAPGYQVPFASDIRRRAQVPTVAVGRITTLEQADTILESNQADLVMFGRRLLIDPFYVAVATQDLQAVNVPHPYARALDSRSQQLIEAGVPEL